MLKLPFKLLSKVCTKYMQCPQCMYCIVCLFRKKVLLWGCFYVLYFCYLFKKKWSNRFHIIERKHDSLSISVMWELGLLSEHLSLQTATYVRPLRGTSLIVEKTQRPVSFQIVPAAGSLNTRSQTHQTPLGLISTGKQRLIADCPPWIWNKACFN